MKVYSVLFLAIKKEEFDFMEYRHSIDHFIIENLGADVEVVHVKLVKRNFKPQKFKPGQIFFNGTNSFFNFPIRLFLFLRQQKPDFIIVHSLKFAFQTFCLKLFLNSETKIIIQHHAESPYKNKIKLWFQKNACNQVSAFLFSSKSLATPFIKNNIILNGNLVHEIPESSTIFKHNDRKNARQVLGLKQEELFFLWVGRLNENKDPMTVLKAFKEYIKINRAVRLFLFYHEDDLFDEIRSFIKNENLQDIIQLKGYLPQKKLEIWYNACDYFISGSHYESTGYALIEALACGCVPIITEISAFESLVDGGNCAITFKPGDFDDLYQKLINLNIHDYEMLHKNCRIHFEKELSFPAISRKIALLIRYLNIK